LEWVLAIDEDYELNPVKVVLPPAADGQPPGDPLLVVDGNKERLKEALDKFFNAIISSYDQIPLGMKQVCVLLKNEVEVKFPSAVLFTMGGYYFLRLVCPSIVSPEGFGILDRVISQKERRPLILISKVLQNLANETAFKEEYMEVMNDWMARAKPKMNEFLSKLSQGPFQHIPLNYSDLDVHVTPDEFHSLTGFVSRSFSKLQKKISENPAIVSNIGYPLMDNLEKILNEISALEAQTAAMETEASEKSKKKKDKEKEREKEKEKDKEKEKEMEGSSGSRDSLRSRRNTDIALEPSSSKKQ
jgi:hypothetical protein